MKFITEVRLVLLLAVCSADQHSNGDEPRIILAPTDKKVVEYGEVSFFCKASGKPAPDIYWRRSREIRITEIQDWYTIHSMPQGSVLRIQGARRLDDGILFECVAENGLGEPATASAKLRVYPYNQVPAGYPQIIEHPKLKAVEKGHDAVLFCTAVGNPEPHITWVKDYLPVNTSDHRLTILPNGLLQIRKSLDMDEGRYECVAENPVGVVYSYAANLYVRVRRVPPYFTIPPESVEVTPGGAANITCAATGYPMPLVRWQLGRIELTPDESIGQNVLHLSNIRKSAIYTCVASSEMGATYADAQVTVIGES